MPLTPTTGWWLIRFLLILIRLGSLFVAASDELPLPFGRELELGKSLAC